MPVYLLHGFRWPREAIRIHIILQNLDDAAAEWLVAPATTTAMLENFHEIYPDSMEYLPQLRFVEQYDPNDTSPGAGTQPYAYVADVCQEIKLGVDVDEVRAKGLSSDQWAAMMELRDKLAPAQGVAWYVVVCGDEERWAPGVSTSSDSVPREGSTGASQSGSDSGGSSARSSVGTEGASPEGAPSTQEGQQQPKGLKKLFSAMGGRKHRSNLEARKSTESLQTAIREPGEDERQKYALTSNSGDKMIVPSAAGTVEKGTVPEIKSSTAKAAMPKLQTQDLGVKTSNRAVVGPGQATQSPGGLSRISDGDEEREVITGPVDNEDDNDDALAAPAPTVRHGKQQDLISRQRKRGSIASFTSAIRGSSPETLRNISPLVRSHPDSFSNAQQHPSPLESHPYQPHRLQHELLPDDVVDEAPPRPSSVAPPASYVPTGAPPPGTASSIRTSRSISPVKNTGRQRSSSRLSALNALEGTSPTTQPSSPRKGHRAGRRSSVQANGGLSTRQSQHSMSSMSNAMSQLYNAHEREFKHRQSVTQEDLIARGLDNMNFGALR